MTGGAWLIAGGAVSVVFDPEIPGILHERAARHGKGSGCPGRLPGQAAAYAWDIAGGKAVMAQQAPVAFEEGEQIGDAVFQHRDTVDPHAEGEALPFVRVDPGRAQDIRMNHARAENFQP